MLSGPRLQGSDPLWLFLAGAGGPFQLRALKTDRTLPSQHQTADKVKT